MMRSYDSLAAPAGATGLIGKLVVTPDDESLGAIRHVVGSAYGSHVAYVVVAAGASTGTQAKMFAIPPAAFSRRTGSDAYILNIAREQVQLVPDECPWI